MTGSVIAQIASISAIAGTTRPSAPAHGPDRNGTAGGPDGRRPPARGGAIRQGPRSRHRKRRATWYAQYVLIDTDSAGGSNVLPRLRSLSLGNCLLLAEQMMPGEIIRIFTAPSARTSRGRWSRTSRLDGVKRVTVLMLTDQG